MELQQASATSIVALFDTTKAQRQTFVQQVLSDVDEGKLNPLQLQLQVKCMEDIIKGITENKEYRETLLAEAQKNGKSFEYHSAKIEVKEVGVKYDYSKCEDVVYNALAVQAKELSEKIKAREAFLKNAPSEGAILTDEETGETAKVFPPAKSSTTAVAVTLK